MKIKKTSQAFVCITLGIIASVFSIPTNARAINRCMELKHPGLYTLKKNLSSNGDCLIINANHVTIDLNGYVISSSTEKYDGNAISGSIKRGLHVRNGTITGFGSAILGPNFSTLDDVKIIKNGSVILGEGSTVTNSMFVDNDYVGLEVGKGSIVKDNTFFESYMQLVVETGSLVVNNVGLYAHTSGFEIGEKSLVMANNSNVQWHIGIQTDKHSNVLFNNTFASRYDLWGLEKDSNVIGNSVGFSDIYVPGCDGTVPNCREFLNLMIETF